MDAPQVTTDEDVGIASHPVSAVEARQVNRKHLFCINGASDFLEVLRELFEEEKYNVTTTNYVPRTFQQIEALQPDGIILDLERSHQVGWALLEELARDADTHQIPVIIISTDQRLLDEAELDLARFGGDAHVVKPLDLEHLLEVVERLVGPA